MVKVVFVCLGNICRSPMAEFILKNIVKSRGLEENFLIESRGTSDEECGNDMDSRAKAYLDEKKVPYEKREASRLQKEDYDKYDFIITMDDKNMYYMSQILEKDRDDKKLFKLLDFSNYPRNIKDPYYTKNFEEAYNDILEGCLCFMKYLKDNNII